MNDPPRLQSEPGKVVLTGEWTLAALLPGLPELQSRLAAGQLADLPSLGRRPAGQRGGRAPVADME